MKCYTFILVLFGCGFFLSAGPALKTAERDGDVELISLSPGAWMHSSTLPNMPKLKANGVVAVSENEAIVIDFPSSRKDTEALFCWIKSKGWKIKYAVPLHWHHDSSGGIHVAFEQGVDVVMLEKTVPLLKKDLLEKGKAALPNKGYETFKSYKRLAYGDRELKLGHHGGAHTVDSVVAWIVNEKVLVGGCLIKSANWNSLGYLGGADLDGYMATLQAVKASYPEAQIVTTGHGSPGGLELLDHNMKLRRELKE